MQISSQPVHLKVTFSEIISSQRSGWIKPFFLNTDDFDHLHKNIRSQGSNNYY